MADKMRLNFMVPIQIQPYIQPPVYMDMGLCESLVETDKMIIYFWPTQETYWEGL